MIQVDFFFSDGLETTNQGCVFMILFCKARKLTEFRPPLRWTCLACLLGSFSGNGF